MITREYERLGWEVPPLLENPESRERVGRMARMIFVIVLIFGIAQGLRDSMLILLGTMAITLFCLHPVILWARGQFGGLPFYPLVAFTYLPIYGLQLLAGHPNVQQYPAFKQFETALLVCLFLGSATLFWNVARKRQKPPMKKLFVLPWSRVLPLAFLGITVCFLARYMKMQDIYFFNRRFMGTVHLLALNLGIFGAFYLSYAWGRGVLSIGQRIYFGFCLAGVFAFLMSSLVLMSISAFLLVTLGGYSLGKGRIPWQSLVLIIAILAVLHYGKSDMRDKYWGTRIGPRGVPVVITDWVKTGLSNTVESIKRPEYEEHVGQSDMLERLSLIHLLLFVRDASPSDYPFMKGSTYTIIPKLMIPRILYPGKPRTHEGTYRISIHYDLQTREEAYKTTIAYGIVVEAYANFGIFGLILIGGIFGGICGLAEQLLRGYPVNSLRFLVGMGALPALVQSQTAGVLVTTIWQASIVVFALCLMIMSVTTWEGAEAEEKPESGPSGAFAEGTA